MRRATWHVDARSWQLLMCMCRPSSPSGSMLQLFLAMQLLILFFIALYAYLLVCREIHVKMGETQARGKGGHDSLCCAL